MAWLRSFWNDEQCQDVVEYTLVMGFVALATAVVFACAGGDIRTIWTVSKGQMGDSGTA